MAGDSQASALMCDETGENPQTSADNYLEQMEREVREVPMPHRKSEQHFYIQLEQGHNIRNYQHELAEAGIQGENCMIVAPTGSGRRW